MQKVLGSNCINLLVVLLAIVLALLLFQKPLDLLAQEGSFEGSFLVPDNHDQMISDHLPTFSHNAVLSNHYESGSHDELISTHYE